MQAGAHLSPSRAVRHTFAYVKSVSALRDVAMMSFGEGSRWWMVNASASINLRRAGDVRTAPVVPDRFLWVVFHRYGVEVGSCRVRDVASSIDDGTRCERTRVCGFRWFAVVVVRGGHAKAFAYVASSDPFVRQVGFPIALRDGGVVFDRTCVSRSRRTAVGPGHPVGGEVIFFFERTFPWWLGVVPFLFVRDRVEGVGEAGDGRSAVFVMDFVYARVIFRFAGQVGPGYEFFPV